MRWGLFCFMNRLLPRLTRRASLDSGPLLYALA
jgi:hypothetical protein